MEVCCWEKEGQTGVMFTLNVFVFYTWQWANEKCGTFLGHSVKMIRILV